MLDRLFLAHPRSVHESYGEHMGSAFSFALRLFAAGIACAIHAIIPALFVTTASRIVAALHDRMVLNRPAPIKKQGGRDK